MNTVANPLFRCLVRMVIITDRANTELKFEFLINVVNPYRQWNNASGSGTGDFHFRPFVVAAQLTTITAVINFLFFSSASRVGTAFSRVGTAPWGPPDATGLLS